MHNHHHKRLSKINHFSGPRTPPTFGEKKTCGLSLRSIIVLFCFFAVRSYILPLLRLYVPFGLLVGFDTLGRRAGPQIRTITNTLKQQNSPLDGICLQPNPAFHQCRNASYKEQKKM